VLISPHGSLLHFRHYRIPACIRSVGYQALTLHALPDCTVFYNKRESSTLRKYRNVCVDKLLGKARTPRAQNFFWKGRGAGAAGVQEQCHGMTRQC